MGILKRGRREAQALQALEKAMQQQEPDLEGAADLSLSQSRAAAERWELSEDGTFFQQEDHPEQEPPEEIREEWTTQAEDQDPGSYSLMRKLWGKITRKTCSPGLTARECEGMDLDRLCCKLRQAGFYKISAYPSRDLSYRRKKLLNTVSGITIGGTGDFKRGTVFPFDAGIEIVYHVLKTIPVGFTPQNLRGTNVEETKAYFRHQGFGIVKAVPIRDLKMGWLKLDGQVERVLVDGFESFRPENEFPADCEITIYYHTFKSSH